MPTIKIDPSVLIAQSAEMMSLTEEYDQLMGSVTSSLTAMNTKWSSNLSNNFAAKITSARSGFDFLKSLLLGGAYSARESAERFQTVDQSFEALRNVFANKENGYQRQTQPRENGDETGESVSLYDYLFSKRKKKKKNKKTTTVVHAKDDYDVKDTYEKKIESEKKAHREYCENNYVSPDEMNEMGWVNVTDEGMDELYSMLEKYGITDKKEIEFFLAVCKHESWDGRAVMEDVIDPPYTNKYKGGGYIQLTWDGNYKAFSEAIGDPRIYSEGCPYVAENYAWESAAWYWKTHVHAEYVQDVQSGCSDIETLRYVSNLVNRGDRNKPCIHWEDRQTRYHQVHNAMQ